MNNKIDFSSDNASGVHPKIMDSLIKANTGNYFAYGNDSYTEQAIEKFKELFSNDCDIYFVYNGTGANVTILKALTNSYNSIICADSSHINFDECGAPEKFTGCKLTTIPNKNGKLLPEDIEKVLFGFGDQHHTQHKVLSITQSTEYGTLYSLEELKTLSNLAKKYNMFFHIDGARISNACVSLNTSFKELILNCGVDALSFGGTKNGMMFGEAVIFTNKKLAEDFKFIRKQATQLSSKMRFISAQFLAFLENDLWKENATKANNMAKLLESKIKGLKGVTITQKVEVNALFLILPKPIIEKLLEKYNFYYWNEAINEIRLMSSFNTKEEDIINFSNDLKLLLA
ncbi:MAG: low specificity L-threonine aldolase [Candidatus Sericytochromatia bacterium]